MTFGRPPGYVTETLRTRSVRDFRTAHGDEKSKEIVL